MDSQSKRKGATLDAERAYQNLLWVHCETLNERDAESKWPLNLLNAAAIELTYHPSLEAQLQPADLLGTVEYVLYTALDERERAILKMFFQCGLGLRPIGEQLDVTKERVRQLKAIALNKLRKSPYCDMLRYGLGTYIRGEFERMSEPLWEGAFQQGYQDGYRDARDNRPMARRATPVLDGLSLQMEEGLRASTYDILRRAEKKTVGDVARMSYQEIESLEKIRPKDISEIVRLLAKYGVFVAPDGNGITFAK